MGGTCSAYGERRDVLYLLNKNSFQKVPVVGRMGEQTVTSEQEGYSVT